MSGALLQATTPLIPVGLLRGVRMWAIGPCIVMCIVRQCAYVNYGCPALLKEGIRVEVFEYTMRTFFVVLICTKVMELNADPSGRAV